MKHILLFLCALCVHATLSAQLRPTLISYTPTTGALQVLTTVPITMSFNKAVTKGSGKIYIRNRTLKTTQTIAATASNVSIGGAFVTISSVNLVGGCYYHVTFDSTAFDSASYHSTGLYDTSVWWFRTGGVGVGVSPVETSALTISLKKDAANGLFVISCNLPQPALINLGIYDLTGRKLTRQTFQATQGSNEWTLQTSLPQGIYIITADDGRRLGSIKAVMR
jgi:hypothetical protein